MAVHGEIVVVEAFDLPEWLGSDRVVWTALSSLHSGHRVAGELDGAGSPLARDPLVCDLLAADQAYPEPVLPDRVRRAVHQAWTHGQVLLVEYDGRLTLAVPGTAFTADLVLECVGRLAKSVGAAPSSYSATLRL